MMLHMHLSDIDFIRRCCLEHSSIRKYRKLKKCISGQAIYSNEAISSSIL